MIPVAIENTFGAIEVGSFGAAFLFGIVTLQCYAYFSQYPDDSKVIRFMVPILWALECTHTARLTIIFYGRAGEVEQYPGFSTVLMLGGFITAIVQCFFAFRVWKLLPKPYCFIGLACAIASIARAITGTYGSIEALTMPSYPEFLVRFQNYLTALLAVGVVIDVVNAAALSSFLIMNREKSFSKTANMIDRLVAYTIRTGVITSVAAIIVLVLVYVLINPHGDVAETSIVPSIIPHIHFSRNLCCPRETLDLVQIASLLSSSSGSVLYLPPFGTLKEDYSKSLSVFHPRIAVTDTSSSRMGPEVTSQAISIEMKTTRLISEDPSDDRSYDSESKSPSINPISDSQPRSRRDHIV
ncbi:hypothetical protein NLJ89_g8329 [Agrocybe chaxingu]|uniref:DUF6534 domain-containing protein n=1 Tax=Agrocybe chaxingu TaxID=84603 RepID=A0A9W8JSU4_9AGAR|nr:hypothetical protein NLJ89_g8329 [Agrocybe chaxingu]